MSQHQQNWSRIMAELGKAVEQLDGPVERALWSAYEPDVKDVFAAQVTEILQAELSSRVGDETRVNVRIKEALLSLGEALVQRSQGTGGGDADV